MADINRRALFGATVAVAAVAAPVAAIAAPIAVKSLTSEQMALLVWADNFAGDLGIKAAHHAIRAGYGIMDVTAIGKHGRGHEPARRASIVIGEGDDEKTVDSNGVWRAFH